MEINIPGLLRIKPNAINKIGKYLRKAGFFRVALYFGEGMKELVGEKIAISLESSEIRTAHEETVRDNLVEEVLTSAFKLPQKTHAIVAVGGGKAIDAAKYAAFLQHIPVISVPTSISNDGFGSPQVSLVVAGRRKSLKASIPYGVIMDTTVIDASPERLTYSGIGDLLSKYTAVQDWKLAYHAEGEAVNDFAVMISLQSVENLVNFPVKSIHNLEFLRLVCGALVMSGVAMEVSGSSRPASGSEHLISHAYDGIAHKPTLHGIQVGIATLATATAQKHPKKELILSVLEETGFCSYVQANPLEKASFIKAIEIAPSIKPDLYTVLSEDSVRAALISEIQTNPFWDRFLSNS